MYSRVLSTKISLRGKFRDSLHLRIDPRRFSSYSSHARDHLFPTLEISPCVYIGIRQRRSSIIPVYRLAKREVVVAPNDFQPHKQPRNFHADVRCTPTWSYMTLCMVYTYVDGFFGHIYYGRTHTCPFVSYRLDDDVHTSIRCQPRCWVETMWGIFRSVRWLWVIAFRIIDESMIYILGRTTEVQESGTLMEILYMWLNILVLFFCVMRIYFLIAWYLYTHEICFLKLSIIILSNNSL